MGDLMKNTPGVHAEHDAINKLKPIKYKKRLQDINILVVRMSRNNKIQSSKPCENCIKLMNILPPKKGYRIKHIYYSDNNGNIVKSNLKILENEDLHYSRFFRKKYNLDD